MRKTGKVFLMALMVNGLEVFVGDLWRQNSTGMEFVVLSIREIYREGYHFNRAHGWVYNESLQRKRDFDFCVRKEHYELISRDL